MARRAYTKRKKFNNKFYTNYSAHPKKATALEYAKNVRAKGVNARVTGNSDTGYEVWIRGRTRKNNKR